MLIVISIAGSTRVAVRVAVDTGGSMDDALIGQFLGDNFKAAHRKPTQIVVRQFDNTQRN